MMRHLSPLWIVCLIRASYSFYTGLSDVDNEKESDNDATAFWSHRLIGSRILLNVDSTYFNEQRRAWVFLGNCERDISQFFHRNHSFGRLVSAMMSGTVRIKLGLPSHFHAMSVTAESRSMLYSEIGVSP